MKSLKHSLMSGAAAIAMLVAIAPAVAQSGTANDPSVAEATSFTDIIVTAQKREQNVQDVPISIEVVSGAQLDAFRSNDFRSVMNLVPNVFVQTTAGNNVIYIRGFGSPPANFSFDQSVSMYMDGIYAGRNRQAQAPFFDLERVEVLRGPQGALFGKNTPAGAVSIISRGPTRNFEGSVTAAYNFDFKGYDVSGFVSGPISDTLGFRIAARIQDQDGWIYNRATDTDDPRLQQHLVRGTLRWEPSDSIDLTAKLEYANQDIRGGVTVSSAVNTPQRPRLTRYLEDSALGQEGQETESVLGSVTANIEVGDHVITSVTGYSWFDSNIVNGFDQTIPETLNNTQNTVYNSFPERFDQFSQEIRLLSPEGQTLEYIIGGYYDRSTYALTQLGGFNIAALNYFGLLQTNFRQTSRTLSVFGQGTLNLGDAFRVIGSLRYTNTRKDGTFDGELVYGPFPLRPLTSASGRINEGLLDPSVTVQYDFSDTVMGYATYARGSKSGGFVSNTYGTRDATFIFDPERSRNIEVGVKSTFGGGRLILNAAVYDLEFSDLQVSVYNPTISTFQTGNAASARSRGIEGQLIWNPSTSFTLNASASWQDAKYLDFPGAACLATQPITECNPASPASIAANNIAGAPLTLASDFTGSVQGTARVPLSSDLRLDTTVVLAGRTKFFNSDNQSPLFGLQKGYAKVDMRIQVTPASERWHVALIGKNLTNELTTGSAFNLPRPITPVSRAILYVEPGRNIAIEAGFRF